MARYVQLLAALELTVAYVDQNGGVARFRVMVNGQAVDEWAADGGELAGLDYCEVHDER